MKRRILKCGPSVLCVFPIMLIGCGHGGSSANNETLGTSVEALTQGEEDASITAAWTALGGAATVGTAVASAADLPNGVGRYQQFTKGVIVWSNDNGAVLVPTSIFNYWVGLTNVQAVEDPTRTQFDYIGLPKNTSDSPANVDTVAWDAKANFDRGIIGIKGGQAFSVQGNIFGRYVLNPAKWGLPTGQSPHTSVSTLTNTWIGQTFTAGEIWTRGDPTNGFTTVELPNGSVFSAWVADPSYGDPNASIADDGQGGQVGSFAGGNIYSSSAGGAFGVPSQPDDGDGHSLVSAYTALGATKSWLGYPTSASGTSPGGAKYSQFQNGLLVMYPNGSTFFAPTAFRNLTFNYDWAQDTGSTGCVGAFGICGTSAGPFFTTSLTAYTNGSSSPIAQGQWPGSDSWCKQQAGAMTCTETGSYCDQSQQQINYPVSLGVANAATNITVDLVSWGYSTGCDEFSGISKFNQETGHLTLQFNIDNQWGANLPRTVAAPDAGDFKFTSHVSNDAPFDAGDWRGEMWWSFHNFNTGTLSRLTYTDTFVGVPTNFSAIDNWGDGLYYKWVYKNSAQAGNCFGMALDSIDAQYRRRTAYDEPIHQWFGGAISTQDGRPLDASANATYADLAQEINVKFGYQLGVDTINYMLLNFINNVTSPLSTLGDVSRQLASNNHPIFAIASNMLFQDGHAIRPYRVGPSGVPCTWISGSTCTQVFVLDPNVPSANTANEQYVEFSADNRWAYNPSDNNGLVYPHTNYSGGSLSGGRISSIPYSVLDHQQSTPVAEIGELLAVASIIILSNNGSVSQVTDETGRTLYTTPRLGAAPMWTDLATGSSAIPNIAPIPLSDQTAGSAQLFASRAPNSVHHYDVGLAQGQANSTPYTAAFFSGLALTAVTAPGTVGVPDQITLTKIGTPDKSIGFKVPSNGAAKNITWTVSGPDKSSPMVLDGLAVTPGQELTAIIENGAARLKVENNGPATSGTLSVGNSTTPPVSTGTLTLPTGESGVDCSWTGTTPKCVVMQPEEASILGFETGSAWSPSPWGSSFPTTIVSSPKTQGYFALAIGSSGYRLLNSVAFSTSILKGITSTLALDVYVPKGPSNPWYGAVQLYATCPSANVNNAYMGQVDLTGKPYGAFTTANFTIPSQVLAAMKTKHSDFFFSIAINMAQAQESVVLDNLRFVAP